MSSNRLAVVRGTQTGVRSWICDEPMQHIRPSR
jgi:hypothetical protein